MSSAILKGAAPAPPPTPPRLPARVVPREVLDAKREAERILAHAAEEAAHRLAAAEKAAQSLAEERSREAFAEGLAAWEGKLAELEQARQGLIAGARREIVELGLSVARKILRHQLTLDPEVISPFVEEVLRSVRNSAKGKVMITVSPEDAPVVERCLAHLKTRDLRWEVMELSTDPALERGGCRVESEHGEIDATVETQVTAIRRILLREGTSHAEP